MSYILPTASGIRCNTINDNCNYQLRTFHNAGRGAGHLIGAGRMIGGNTAVAIATAAKDRSHSFGRFT